MRRATDRTAGGDDGDRHGASGHERRSLAGQVGEATAGVEHAPDDPADDRQAGEATVGAGESMELAAQGAAGPEQQGLDRADAHAELAGDLFVGKALSFT